jgi:hypothetical protein
MLRQVQRRSKLVAQIWTALLRLRTFGGKLWADDYF